MSDPKPKKMVSRNFAFALGIICIVLVAGLVGAFAYYVKKINDRDSTISSLNTQITSLNTQVSDQNNTISSLNTQLVILQNQTNNLYIWGTENSTVWINNQTTRLQLATSSWIFGITGAGFEVNSSGYVLITVSSTSYSTSVQYVYITLNGTAIDYESNQAIQLGLNGIAIFPVEPTTDAYIQVTTVNNVVQGAFSLTAIYYY